MASKLHKAASIFTRIDGLLKSGVTKMDDRPMWYDIYKAFPPTYEPEINKPMPVIPIRNIYYKEDIARAKIHKMMPRSRVWNLRGMHRDTDIQLYMKKLEEGLTEDEAFEHVKDTLIAARESKAEANEAKDASNIGTEEVKDALDSDVHHNQ